MNICLDLRALQIGHEKRGIGMYMVNILENLPDNGDKYIMYVFDKSNPIEDLDIKVKFRYKLVTTASIKTTIDKPADFFNVIRLIRHRFRELSSKSIDVFVQFDFMLGLPKWRNTKKVVVAYDLIPLIKRNQYLPRPKFAWRHSVGYKAKTRAALRSIYYNWRYKLQYGVYKKADKIIAISESTKQSFIELLGIKKQKITAIPLAPVITHKPHDKSILKDIDKPFIFYVGGTDSRKRIEDIVFAFNVARGRGADICLVLAGNEFKRLEDLPNIEGRNAIINSPYKPDIHLVGFVTEEQKLALYKYALAFIFCSEYEGFGLPVLEAMASSCPVISYSNSSIPEISGKATILVNTYDYGEVAKGIIKLTDAAFRSNLIKLGTIRAKKYSWAKHSTEFIKSL